MKNYRTLAIVLGLLLIASIVLNIIPSGDEKFVQKLGQGVTPERKAYLKRLADKRSDFTSNACNVQDPTLQIHPCKAGDLIDRETAIKKMNQFRAYNRRSNNTQRIEPYAFAFGRENLKEMLNKMEEYNLQNIGSPESKLIQGIRVYLTWALDEDDKPLGIDILAVPVFGDGDDYIQLESPPIINDDNIILNASIPCPNNCNLD